MMPKHSRSGDVCEVVLERLHYSNAEVNLDPGLPRELILQIFDELAPAKDRGARTMDFGTDYISEYAGNSFTSFAEYANVSFNIYGIAERTSGSADVIAAIRWKKRECR